MIYIGFIVFIQDLQDHYDSILFFMILYYAYHLSMMHDFLNHLKIPHHLILYSLLSNQLNWQHSHQLITMMHPYDVDQLSPFLIKYDIYQFLQYFLYHLHLHHKSLSFFLLHQSLQHFNPFLDNHYYTIILSPYHPLNLQHH